MKVFLIITILIFQGCAGTHKKEVSIKQNEEVADSKKSSEIKPAADLKKEIPIKEIKENKLSVETESKKTDAIPAATSSIEKSVEKESPPPAPQLKKIETAITPQESIKEPLAKAAPQVDISSVKPAETKIPSQTDKKGVPPKTQIKESKPDEKVDSKDLVIITIPNKSVKGTSTFLPEILRIKVGQKVMWVNEDDRTHFINKKPDFNAKSLRSYGEDDEDEETKKIKPNENSFSNSPLMPKGKKWIFQFKEGGTVSYYCFTHPLEMRGKIIIE